MHLCIYFVQALSMADSCRTGACLAGVTSLRNPSPSEHVPRGQSRRGHHLNVSACEVYRALGIFFFIIYVDVWM